ncbi:MAG TPA: hypothetical protein VI612_02250 [Candidatus Nanoarchaeia archaeon]|nr:hypothetical protein [Candidatus Nanoarchaeia archaeon]
MKFWMIAFLLLLVACAKPAGFEEKMMDISTAVQLGKPIRCVSEQDDQTSTIYMKGSMMRIDTMPVNAHGIYTADAFYSWIGTQGTVMKMSDLKKLTEDAGKVYNPPNQQEIIAKAQSANAECGQFDVGDDMFVPPADVQFQDLGEMLKGRK